MLSIEGIPAFYIHSLLGTGNDYNKFANTNNNRAINRHNWDLQELESLLQQDNQHARLFRQIKTLIGIRKRQKAFHPNAIMFTLHIGDEVFAYWRQSCKREQSIFCLNNVTGQTQQVQLSTINLIADDRWVDLVTGAQITEKQKTLDLQPYQFVWLSNKV
ncbi:MAG: alpha-glucosidase C-terminal domain-containing protein [Pseudohongiellaceae bacterium]